MADRRHHVETSDYRQQLTCPVDPARVAYETAETVDVSGRRNGNRRHDLQELREVAGGATTVDNRPFADDVILGIRR